MHRIFLNSSPLGPFFLGFYLIALPKGARERDKLDLEQIILKTIDLRPPSRQIMRRILLN